MKKIFLLLFGFYFLATENVISQVISHIPDSNSYWMFASEHSGGGVDFYYGFFFPQNKEDTLINNKQYIKAYKVTFPLEINYLCAFREDSTNRGFIVPPNQSQEYETIDLNLFEASLNVGDTLDSLLIYLNDSFEIVKGGILSIDYETFNSNSYKKIDILCGNQPPYNALSLSEYYLYLSSPFNNPSVLNMSHQLPVCISIFDTVRYSYYDPFNEFVIPPPIGSNSNCLGVYTNIEDNNKVLDGEVIKIAANNLFIREDIDFLMIHNLYGQVVYSEKNILGNSTVDLSFFQKGIYVISYKGKTIYKSDKITIQ